MMYDVYRYGFTVADQALNMNDCKKEIQTKHYHPYKVKTEESGDLLGIRSKFWDHCLYSNNTATWRNFSFLNNEKRTTYILTAMLLNRPVITMNM